MLKRGAEWQGYGDSNADAGFTGPDATDKTLIYLHTGKSNNCRVKSASVTWAKGSPIII